MEYVQRERLGRRRVRVGVVSRPRPAVEVLARAGAVVVPRLRLRVALPAGHLHRAEVHPRPLPAGRHGVEVAARVSSGFGRRGVSRMRSVAAVVQHCRLALARSSSHVVMVAVVCRPRDWAAARGGLRQRGARVARRGAVEPPQAARSVRGETRLMGFKKRVARAGGAVLGQHSSTNCTF